VLTYQDYIYFNRSNYSKKNERVDDKIMILYNTSGMWGLFPTKDRLVGSFLRIYPMYYSAL